MIERLIQIARSTDWVLQYWSKEQMVAPGVRCDVCMVFEKGNRERTFYLETQLSSLDESRWAKKLAKYVWHYDVTGRPFRVLLDLEKKRQVEIAQLVADGLLSDRPDNNLFLFRRDDAWITRWNTPYALF